jgi:hypothetical protein
LGHGCAAGQSQGDQGQSGFFHGFLLSKVKPLLADFVPPVFFANLVQVWVYLIAPWSHAFHIDPYWRIVLVRKSRFGGRILQKSPI